MLGGEGRQHTYPPELLTLLRLYDERRGEKNEGENRVRESDLHRSGSLFRCHFGPAAVRRTLALTGRGERMRASGPVKRTVRRLNAGHACCPGLAPRLSGVVAANRRDRGRPTLRSICRLRCARSPCMRLSRACRLEESLA